MDSRPTDAGLAAALTALGPTLEYPPTPNFAPYVAARLRERQAAPTPWWSALIAPGRRFAFAVTALVVVASLGLMVSEGARKAVADWLGVEGVRISFGDPPDELVAQELVLGDPVSLEEAGELASFDVKTPVLPGLGEPEIYFDTPPPGGQVSLVYRANKHLPGVVNEPDIGLLINEFKGSTDEGYFKKIGDPATDVDYVEVSGADGYWIHGDPHFLTYVDDAGNFTEERTRLVGNVLLWESAGVTYRLESDLTLRRALAIAESLR